MDVDDFFSNDDSQKVFIARADFKRPGGIAAGTILEGNSSICPPDTLGKVDDKFSAITNVAPG